MFININNNNYGYATTTHNNYVAISNPDFIRWTNITASRYHTGSVDYFRYNKNTDNHDYIGTIYKKFHNIESILLTESGSNLTTDTSSFNILIDKNNYTSSLEDSFGTSLDLYNKLLIIGSPYYKHGIITDRYSYLITSSVVEIHNLLNTEFTSSNNSDTFITSLTNPDVEITESFGKSVSINNNWIIVGSPYISSSKGMVYVYRNISTGSNYSWSLYQKLTGSQNNDLFGWDLKLNKKSGSYDNSLVVGCGNMTSSKAYYFELISGSWDMTYQFLPTTDIYPLTFGNYTPFNPTMSVSSGFGYAVSTYGDSVIIGAPKDRIVSEYSGSLKYNQGSVYIYEKCLDSINTKFALSLKTYGTSSILKNNLLGFSVDITDEFAIAGIPKTNYNSLNSCYIQNTLNLTSTTACSSSLNNILLGQVLLLEKNTTSGSWEIKNIFQKKKKHLSPYRTYGYDVSISDKSIVVGAPLIISGSSLQTDILHISNSGVILDDIMGKAYIANLDNLQYDFHVGNVFYKNGKIVVMTSGSMFDGLFYDPNDLDYYKYLISLQGHHTLFEKQIVCTVDPGEFNVSTNPSSIVKNTGSLDINKNGKLDFQDVDIILRYMQYKNTSTLGIPTSTEWSSSIIKTDDERSLYNYYISESSYNFNNTMQYVSQSIINWEFTNIEFQNTLDFNNDNKIDLKDMSILWKYFSNRLTQENYVTYITPSSKRKSFNNIIDYMNFISQKNAIPNIKSDFLDYERLTLVDKTGSYLAPFVTTIGLYSGLDLVTVAKLGTPIKITPELPINFVIKIDW